MDAKSGAFTGDNIVLGGCHLYIHTSLSKHVFVVNKHAPGSQMLNQDYLNICVYSPEKQKKLDISPEKMDGWKTISSFLKQESFFRRTFVSPFSGSGFPSAFPFDIPGS